MPDNVQVLAAPRLDSESVPQHQPSGARMVGVPTFRWPTPGAAIAQRLVGKRGVRLVVESFDGDTYGITVLLTADPEALLTEIYDAEHALYGAQWTHPFSLRATCPGGDIEAHARRYAAGHIVHYDGRWFA